MTGFIYRDAVSAAVPLDATPATWVCVFCEARVVFTDDVYVLVKHLAHLCPLLPDAEFARMDRMLREVSAYGSYARAVTAHNLKQSDAVAPLSRGIPNFERQLPNVCADTGAFLPRGGGARERPAPTRIPLAGMRVKQ